ncbi:MAG: hypothetical protein V4539_22985 [Bacteroidota bacterium]
MKTILTWLCCIIAAGATAQSVVTRSYPVAAGQKVELHFDYPRIVKISTWDKNEVSVVAHVNINDGENDSAFELEDKTADGTITIRNRIKDMDKLPRRYTVIENGKKTVFRSKEDFREYNTQTPGTHRITSNGVDMEITVEVKVPANTSTNINATYGMVEMVNFNAPATVNATYGGIDATVSEPNTGKLQATTSYGEILTNLNLKLTDKTDRDFFTSITAEPGKGPTYILKSTYGKIYLRKP